jgi:DNA repair exonuclease SbcCD ATPase subunit
MKITLKNFRCYTDSTFDFGEEGISLLSGDSGSGKTSILLGIYFALFGTGSKLAMYGKTSCSVLLEINDFIITRTKRPNRLIVKTKNGEYEDDGAQSIIDEKYGKSFKTTGYISQNARDSFILMSPIEKLSFLESFAFSDINLMEIKKRCKDLIKERNETLLKTNSQLEMASSMIKEIEPPENIEFPLKCSLKNRDKAIKNEIIKNKNAITLIKRCKHTITNLRSELHSLQVLNAQIQSKSDSMSTVIEKISDISLKRDGLSCEGESKLREYENDLLIVVSQRELLSLQKRYEEDRIKLENMKTSEIKDKDKKIQDIKDINWVDYSEDECKNSIKDFKLIIKDLEKIKYLENELSKYKVDENKLKLLIQDLKDSKILLEEKKKILNNLELQLEIFQCPSCDIFLRYNENELLVHKGVRCENTDINIDKVTKEISILKKKISSLETSTSIKQNNYERYKQVELDILIISDEYDEIPDTSEIKIDLEYIVSYLSSHKELTRQLTNLNSTEKYSPIIISFENTLEKQNRKIQLIKKSEKQENEEKDEEELRSNIMKLQQNIDKLEEYNQTIETLEKEQHIYENQLSICKTNHTKKYNKIKIESDIISEINKLLSDLKNLNIKQVNHQKNVDNVEKYQKYEKTKDHYDMWVKKIDILHTEEIECRKLYASATLLKEKILEAESIAMLNIISSINTHSQCYLEAFFPDNPISVKLVTFKESKSGAKKGTKKPQINLEIEYKGMEADINMLSGGELSRVILAYSLALGEMFNTPLMLLDECTSSLDQELTGVVMDGIRENFTDTLVLIIAHQVIEGQFDKVVKI